MSKDKEYIAIDRLAQSILKGCTSVTNGRWNIESIKKLLLEVKDLEERLIILNYKAAERLTKKGAAPAKTEDKKNESEYKTKGTLTFSFDNEELTEPDNQISLIDSIEEIKEQETAVEENEVVEAVKKKAVKKEKQLKKSDKTSINEKVKQSSAPSLAQKLGKKPIKSIKGALSVNARAGMVKELFEKDSGAFVKMVDDLDAASDLDQASTILDAIRAKKKWDESSKNLLKLQELIERRFAS